MRSATFLVFLVCVLAWAGVAGADDYTGASGGNYNVGANWSGGSVPDSDDSAYIRNGATVTLDSSVSSPIELWLGGATDPNGVNGSALHILPGAVLTTTTGSFTVAQAYDASVSQSGGSVAVPYFHMSESGGGDSTYDLTGGSLIMDYNLRAGTPTWTMDIGRGGGTARFTQTGGYVSLINNYYLNVGYGPGSLGEFTMTNGNIYVGAQQFNVGSNGGRGTFTMTGGRVESRYKFQVGYLGEVGVFNQLGGTVLQGPDEHMLIGQCSLDAPYPALGIYNLSGGLLQVLGERRIYIGRGYNATYGPGTGQLNVSGGSVVATGGENISVGYKGGCGTLSVSGTGYVTYDEILVADSYEYAIPTGCVNVSGGLLNPRTDFSLGRNGPAVLNVSGGSVLAGSGSPTNSITAGANDPNAEGVINVTGGRLSTLTNLLLGYQRGRGTLNLSGGTVDVGYNTIIARETPSSGAPGRAEVNISGGSFQGKVV
ncbi:MAG: hypothetical protein MUP47_02765, partial [Phycisphaerae bacterium]|nr:hypothetical protein [Phycisphaerae bacterium]